MYHTVTYVYISSEIGGEKVSMQPFHSLLKRLRNVSVC